MKKIFIFLCLFISLLFLSCSHNGETNLKNYFTVTAEADGFRIKTVCESEYDRNIIEVYDESEHHNNLVAVNLQQSEEFLYPYVAAGKKYTIIFRIRDSNNNLKTAYTMSNVIASGGKGDFYVTDSGISYDGNKTLRLIDFDFHCPVETETLERFYTIASLTFISPDNTYRITPSQSNVFDYKNSVITIDNNLIDNSPSGYLNFTTYYNLQVLFEDNWFIYESGRGIINTLGKTGSSAWTKDSYLTVTSNSEGFNIKKQFDDKNPNVRIKVFNETENHYCPTVKLNEYYANFNYDYLNPGDFYSIEVQCWDSNWGNYNSRKIQHVKAYTGNGDSYFVSNGFDYEQGELDSLTSIIHLRNAEFVNSSYNYSISGNIWYFDEKGKYNTWNYFDYNYDQVNKDLAIDIRSELKKIRGKTFYTELSANWNNNGFAYELGLINNQDELERFKDNHIAYVNHIENDYTILNESGKCLISESLQGKTAYLIKYNKSNAISKDKSPLKSTDSNISSSRNVINQENLEIKGKVEKTFEPIDSGKRLNPVINNSRAARAIISQDYTVGQRIQFNVFTKFESSSLVNATLKAVGNHCYVWYVNNNSLADRKLQDAINKKKTSFQTLADKFDAIYDLETSLIGPKKMLYNYSNIITTSETDRVNILVFDIYSDHTDKQQGGTYGYFYGNDYYNKQVYSSSNECEMIYIDSAFLALNPESIYSTLAHEFQHLLNFINKNLNKNLSTESWFTEMMSLGTELALQNKCLGFTENSVGAGRASLFNSGYNFGFELWGAHDLTYDYSNATIFINYLMTNYGGINLLQEIAHNGYANETAITEALVKMGYNETFDTVMMKMGQMIVNTYDSTVSPSDLTLNRDVTSVITDNNGIQQSLLLQKLDLKNCNCYTPENYSYTDKVKFSNCDIKNGPTIMKPNTNFAELYPKAIGVYQLTTNCGSVLEIAESGDNIALALYFK